MRQLKITHFQKAVEKQQQQQHRKGHLFPVTASYFPFEIRIPQLPNGHKKQRLRTQSNFKKLYRNIRIMNMRLKKLFQLLKSPPGHIILSIPENITDKENLLALLLLQIFLIVLYLTPAAFRMQYFAVVLSIFSMTQPLQVQSFLT